MAEKKLTVVFNADTGKFEAAVSGLPGKVAPALKSIQELEKKHNDLLDMRSSLQAKASAAVDQITAKTRNLNAAMQEGALKASLVKINQEAVQVNEQLKETQAALKARVAATKEAARIELAIEKEKTAQLKAELSARTAEEKNAARVKIAQLKLEQAQFNAGQAADKLAEKNQKLEKTHRSLAESVITSTTIYKTYVTALHAVEAMLANIPAAGIRQQQAEAAATAIFGSEQGLNNLKFVQDLSLEAGANLVALQESYTKFAPAATLAGAAQQEVNETFSDFTKVGTVLHFSQQQLTSLYLALEQMYAKTVVNSEEIKKQLGNVLPGAVEIGAQAWAKFNGKATASVAAFMDAMKKNLVVSKDFIPLFAKEYAKIFGGENDEIYNNVRDKFYSNLQRMQTQYELFSRDLAKVSEELLNEVVRKAGNALKFMRENLQGILQIGSIVGVVFLTEALAVLLPQLSKLKNLLVFSPAIAPFAVVGGSLLALATNLTDLTLKYETFQGVSTQAYRKLAEEAKNGSTEAIVVMKQLEQETSKGFMFNWEGNQIEAGKVMEAIYYIIVEGWKRAFKDADSNVSAFFQGFGQYLNDIATQFKNYSHIIARDISSIADAVANTFTNILNNFSTGFQAILAYIAAAKDAYDKGYNIGIIEKQAKTAFANAYAAQAEEFNKEQTKQAAQEFDKILDAQFDSIRHKATQHGPKIAGAFAQAVNITMSEALKKQAEEDNKKIAALKLNLPGYSPESMQGESGDIVGKTKKGFNERKAVLDQELQYVKALNKEILEDNKYNYEKNLISFKEYIGKKLEIELGDITSRRQLLEQQLSVANKNQRPEIAGNLALVRLEEERKIKELTREREDFEAQAALLRLSNGKQAIDLTKEQVTELARLSDEWLKATLSEREYYKVKKLQQQGNAPDYVNNQLMPMFDEAKASENIKKYIEHIDKAKEHSLSFGDVSNTVFNGQLSAISKLGDAYGRLIANIDNTSQKLKENADAQAQNALISDPTERLNNQNILLNEQVKLEKQKTQQELIGAAQIAGAVAQLFGKKTAAAKAFHNIEMGLAVARMAMDAKAMAMQAAKTAVDVAGGAAKMFSQSGWLGFAGVAAMLAVMAALGFSKGSGNSSYIPDSKDFGTVLGDSQAKSESTKNVYDLLKDIYAREYLELRGINVGVNQLTKGISSWVTKFFQGGGLQIASAPKFKNTVLDSMSNVDPLLGSIWKNDPTINFAAKFLMGVPKVIAQGIYIAKQNLQLIGDGINIIAKEFIDIEQKGLLFSSKKTVFRPLNELLIEGLTDLFVGAKKTLRGTVAFFGADLQDMITAYVLPRIKINLKGKSAEKVTEKMTNVLSTALDKMTQAVMGDVLGKYQQLGEGLYETAIRIQAQAVITKDFFRKLGSSITLTNTEWADLSQDLIDLATDSGTASERLKQLQDTMNNFISTFAPETIQNTLKFTNLAGQLAYSFSLLKGDNASGIKDSFYSAITASQDLGNAIYNFTASLGTNNKEVIAEMLKLGDAAKEISKFFSDTLKPVKDQIKTLQDSIDTTSIEDLMTTLANSKDINQQKALVGTLQKKIMDKYNTELNAIKTIKSAFFDLANVVKKLLLSDLSTLDPKQKFEEAQGQYLELLAQVNSSDVVKAAEAAGKLGSAAETYLSEAKKYFGSTEAYAAIFQAVTNTLKDLSATVVDKDQAIIDATNALATTAIDKLNTLATTYVEAFQAYLKEQVTQQAGQITPPREQTFLEGLYKELAIAMGTLQDKNDDKIVQRKINAFQLGGDALYDAVINNDSATIQAIVEQAKQDLKNDTALLKTLKAEKKNAATTEIKESLIAQIEAVEKRIQKEKALVKFKADGGVTSGLTLVGERGPELLNLPAGTNVINNTNTQRMLAFNDKQGLDYLARITNQMEQLNARMEKIERKSRLVTA